MGDTLRILIVDDDPWILRMVAAVLEKHGYAIMTASDGNEALRLADKAPPDLVITDIMMPGMDGWTLVKHLRAQTRFSLVPVIFLTALSSDDDRIRGFRLGADDYLPKPFRFEELDLRVTNTLRKHRELQAQVMHAMPAGDIGSESGIHGSLDQLGLSSLLAMLEMERKTGLLLLRRENAVGRIFLRAGRVVAASVDGGPRGADAVYHLLTWASGRFDFSVVDVEMEDTVGASTTHLLMEGARRLDEANRQAERGRP